METKSPKVVLARENYNSNFVDVYEISSNYTFAIDSRQVIRNIQNYTCQKEVMLLSVSLNMHIQYFRSVNLKRIITPKYCNVTLFWKAHGFDFTFGSTSNI